MIDVVCAVIAWRGKVLAAQRSETMSLPLKWEFPGGKVSREETPEQALMREIDEELGLAISIHEKLPDVIHHYPEKTVRLMPFVCAPASETITLREHRSVVWCGAAELSSLDWCEADIPVAAAVSRDLAGLDDRRFAGPFDLDHIWHDPGPDAFPDGFEPN